LISEEYIPNTCAAPAVAGYVELAPDIFHPVPKGATPEEMNKALSDRTDDDYLRGIRAGAEFLKTHEVGCGQRCPPNTVCLGGICVNPTIIPPLD
jgi:dienelactone hydrolase